MYVVVCLGISILNAFLNRKIEVQKQQIVFLETIFALTKSRIKNKSGRTGDRHEIRFLGAQSLEVKKEQTKM